MSRHPIPRLGDAAAAYHQVPRVAAEHSRSYITPARERRVGQQHVGAASSLAVSKAWWCSVFACRVLQMEGDHQNGDFEPYPYIPVFSYLIRSAPWHSSAPNLLRRTNTSRSAVVCSPVLTVEARLMQFRAFFSLCTLGERVTPAAPAL